MKKAAELLKADDCRAIDELPFWFNGRGFVSGKRSRLGIYEKGEYRFLTGENSDVELGGLSPEGDRLYYACTDWTGSMPLGNRLYSLDTATLESENITVREGAQHYWSLPLGGGRAAALVNTMDKYGINENPKLYLARKRSLAAPPGRRNALLRQQRRQRREGRGRFFRQRARAGR